MERNCDDLNTDCQGNYNHTNRYQRYWKNNYFFVFINYEAPKFRVQFG